MGLTHRIRLPAVAGTFYPDDPDVLRAQLDGFLARADEQLAASPHHPVTRPHALIAPHAGYVYSGPVAASAYVRLRPFAEEIRRVVLLGPAHRMPVASLALSSADVWLTPLGEVPLDHEGRDRMRTLPWAVVDDRAHAPEHSLEVHVPFLQRVLGTGWSLLPIVVGGATEDEVAAALELVWDDPGTLVVVSTDLSHYHDHATATRLDEATCAAIVARDRAHVGPHDACGAHPLRGLLALGDCHPFRLELLDRRTSGDTAGDRDRVVGYASFLVTDGR